MRKMIGQTHISPRKQKVTHAGFGGGKLQDCYRALCRFDAFLLETTVKARRALI